MQAFIQQCHTGKLRYNEIGKKGSVPKRQTTGSTKGDFFTSNLQIKETHASEELEKASAQCHSGWQEKIYCLNHML